MTREDYEARQQAKLDRMAVHAENAKTRSDAAYTQAKQMADVIPFGQPILVGHHSERRDRNYRDRIHNTFGKSVEEQKKAEYWERRIEAAESNRAISADDPEAIPKLEQRIADCQSAQELWKAINTIVTSKRKNYSEEQRKNDLRHLEVNGEPVHLSDAKIAEQFEPDFCGRIGIPSYLLQNNNANIRRMKLRVESLKQKQEAGDQEKEFETTEGTVKIVYNTYENRVQILFPGKPSQETRTLLKKSGFRWARSHAAWQRHLNNAGKWDAKHVVKQLMSEPEAMDMTTYRL